MKMKILWMCACLCVLQITVQGFYEDQIGKFDWRQQWIGKVEHVIWEKVTRSHPRKIVVGSENNVIATLSPKTGSLLWRQVLEKDGNIKVLSIGKGEVTAVSTSTAGFKITSWDINRGHFLWNSFISCSADELERSFVSIIEDEVYVIKGFAHSHFTVTGFNLRSGEETSARSFIPAPWFQTHTSCQTTSKLLACADAATSSLFYIDIAEGNAFSSSLFTFVGLKGLSPVASVTFQKCPSCSLVDAVVIAGEDGERVLVQLGSEAVLLREDATARVLGLVEVDDKSYIYTLLPNRQLKFVDAASGEELTEFTSVLEIPSLYGDIEFISPCLFAKRDHFLTYRILAVTQDHATLVFQPPGKLSWYREEALASIEAVEMIDLPVSPSDAAFEEEFKSADNVFSMFLHRVSSQVAQLQSLVLSVLGVSVSEQLGRGCSLTRDQFNLHKIIVVVTSAGKIYGLDNTNGDILWSRLTPSLSPGLHENKLRLYIQRTSAHIPYSPQAVIVGSHKESGGGMLYAFNPLTGEVVDKDNALVQYTNPIISAYMLHQMSGEFIHPLIVIDKFLQVHVFPPSDWKVVVRNKNKLFTYLADSTTGDITGYTFKTSTAQKLSLTETWKVSIPADNHEIVQVVSKRPWERVHSQGRVMGDRSVLFKYINPNLIAVITQGFHQSVKSYLNVYLMDGVTGHIVHALSHKRARGLVLAVHSENWLVYSYYNEKARRIELASLELYEGKEQNNATAFSSLSHPVSVMVEQQSFILPAGGLDALCDTVTEKGITSKHLLFAVSHGGIVELPWFFLDPRRPLVPTAEQREEGLIPYMPELPLPPEATINYNQSLHRVRNIYTTHSGLESTSLVFVYGLDLFYTRVTPSKTFDVLKDDFDHFFICVVLVALIAASYISKQLAARKALKQAWK